ncbi:hypothetical protein EXVG_00302 [Emiliania huxleyi virus 202]|nr:hypothetical protein EXVG_00302 [Emiliania huxleyi virus 202]AHA54251.1 putative membrane protein [Emiliania huxleyi virus 18]AHA55299.1 putative membrane protein [Emiliania huxleyi virus 156]
MSESKFSTDIIIIVIAVILAILAAAIWTWIIRDRIKERRARLPDVAMQRNFVVTVPQMSRRSSVSSVSSTPPPRYSSIDGAVPNPFVVRQSSGHYNNLGTLARDLSV